MSFVAKISMPGFDVHSATPEQCTLHSDFPPLKSKANQSNPHFALLDVDFTGTVTQGITHTIYEFAHGYGYIPASFSSIVFNDGVGDIVGVGFSGVGVTLAINAYCDATNFYVTLYDNASWTNLNARLRVSYYVFAEDGT